MHKNEREMHLGPNICLWYEAMGDVSGGSKTSTLESSERTILRSPPEVVDGLP